jgi:hypothetical protein
MSSTKLTSTFLILLFVAVGIALGFEILEVALSPSISMNALFETVVMISLSTFYATLVFFLATLKWNLKNWAFWAILLLNLPVSITYTPKLIEKAHLHFIVTTTPDSYRYAGRVSKEEYRRDVEFITSFADSLIRLGVVTQPAEFARRMFNGSFYEDSLHRDWGFPAPPFEVPIELRVDTLFHDPGSALIAVFIIRKYVSPVPISESDSIRYVGNAFVFNRNKSAFQFHPLSYSYSTTRSFESCSKGIRDYYLKKLGQQHGKYNLNDLRFWTSKDWTIVWNNDGLLKSWPDPLSLREDGVA